MRKRDWSGNLLGIVVFIVLILVIVAGPVLTFNAWVECRETNSFWYCFRVVIL